MKVGLIDIEPKIFNTAYMQIAYHHKQLGDTVEWAAPLEYNRYDTLYCSSLFDFTDKSQVPSRAVCGGTGFDLTTELPFDCDYDYSMYPTCDFSIQWFSRGCIRKCPFCIVWKKEGKIKSVCPHNLNPQGKWIKVTDNNFFANSEWLTAIKLLQQLGQKVEFQSGIDIRLFNDEQGEALQSLKIYKMLHSAWDNPKDDLLDKFKLLCKYIKPYRIMPYVLIGYWSTPEQDLYRVMALRGLGIKPFVMPYNKNDYYQKRFARWVNHKAIFMSVEWEDYR